MNRNLKDVRYTAQLLNKNISIKCDFCTGSETVVTLFFRIIFINFININYNTILNVHVYMYTI